MYLQKVISRKTLLRKFFDGLLKVNVENSRIRIRIRIRILYSEAWNRGSGSTPKWHASATLHMGFHADLDPDRSQTLKSQKVVFA
jgi:hypothetical protein